MTLLQPIEDADQPRRDWILTLNGTVVPTVNFFALRHPQFGVLTYGQTPPGYDGWGFRETHGGGSVILPFVVLRGELYVGLVGQDRHNLGGFTWNAPRGFADSGEGHDAAARRELAEEAGLDAPSFGIFELRGEPANPNSSFFETLRTQDGVRFYAVELRPEDIVERSGKLVVRPDRLSDRALDDEIAAGLRFFPWREAVRLKDMFTAAAVARLLAHLESSA